MTARRQSTVPARSSLIASMARERPKMPDEPEERCRELRRRLKTFALMGPSTTPDLFPSREDELAYQLNAFLTLMMLGVAGDRSFATNGSLPVKPNARASIDGHRPSVAELDRMICHWRDARVYAAARESLYATAMPPLYSGTDLDELLDEAMTRLANDHGFARIDDANRCILLPKSVAPFIGVFEDQSHRHGDGPSALALLTRYATSRRKRDFRDAIANSYRVCVDDFSGGY